MVTNALVDPTKNHHHHRIHQFLIPSNWLDIPDP